jgi:hypothetical protein
VVVEAAMNPRRTSVFLLALVLGLAAAVWWQRRREDAGAFELDRPLFPGLAGAELETIRLDHLERGLELTLRRDEAAGWKLVDPLEYPAEMARVRALIDVLVTNRAVDVGERDLEPIGLAPPRAVLEITTRGAARPQRLELGKLDLDGQHVFVRVDGRLLRTLRNLDTALERELWQWRRAAILELAAESVVAFTRTGTLVLEGEPLPLALAAERDVAGWRASEPFQVLLDPLPLTTWLHTVSGLRARRFVDMEGDPAVYRPGAPTMTLELVDLRGARTTLEFRKVEGGGWLCERVGEAQVFEVEEQSVLQLALPAEAFVDLAFTRLVRDAVERVRLVAPAGELMLEREGTLWRVTPAGEPGAARKADPGAVADLLGALERARFQGFLPDSEAVEAATHAVWLEGQDLFFGAALWQPRTGDVVLARRDDENLWLRADATLLRLAETPLEELWDRQLVVLPELAVARIELAHAGKQRVFVRDAKNGRWSPQGQDAEALELLPVVERLLSVRAERFLPSAAKRTPSDAVEVTVVPSGGDPVHYAIGLDAGQELFVDESTQAHVVPGLHEQLVALVRGR